MEYYFITAAIINYLHNFISPEIILWRVLTGIQVKQNTILCMLN